MFEKFRLFQSRSRNGGELTRELGTTAFATMALAGSVSKLNGVSIIHNVFTNPRLNFTKARLFFTNIRLYFTNTRLYFTNGRLYFYYYFYIVTMLLI